MNNAGGTNLKDCQTFYLLQSFYEIIGTLMAKLFGLNIFEDRQEQ